jgi:hypothetical protein
MTTSDTPPNTLHRSTQTLDRLLDAELAFSPSYLEHYSSHLAMALVALHQLGATPDVLESTLAAHAREDAELRDDRDLLDQRIEEVERNGITATVRARVPDLVRGPGSQLFHPLIRLAYALDVGHQGQVAAALLDWERRHHVLPFPDPMPGDRRLPDVAADLAARPAGTWTHTFDFDGTARRPELGDSLAGVAIDDHTLDDISAFAISAHVAADDFITLHLVTGARALRAVSVHLDRDMALQLAAHTVPVLATAFAAVGAPALPGHVELDELRRIPLPDRDTIAERAVGDRDPHVIKLANVALVEEARTSDPLYRYAAARVVGLLGS